MNLIAEVSNTEVESREADIDDAYPIITGDDFTYHAVKNFIGNFQGSDLGSFLIV